MKKISLSSPEEKEAIKYGLALLNHKWNGNNDFEKGMRFLQQKLMKDRNENTFN